MKTFKHYNKIIVREKPKNLVGAFEPLAQLPEDFFAEGREDMPPQERICFARSMLGRYQK